MWACASLSVTTPSTGKATFHPGKRVRHTANDYARLRPPLAEERHSRRETTNDSHRAARETVQSASQSHPRQTHHHRAPICTYRARESHRYQGADKAQETQAQEKRQRLGKSLTQGPASANRVYSQWSFAELQSLISYKAVLAGQLSIKVDAEYTSKACPMCGHTADENRPRKGLLFVCQNPVCCYTLHADLVGARNVTMRTLLLRQDWSRTGCLSLIPDASDNEAKAARLQRYAELRWSPDVNPSLRSLTGGS